MGLSRAGSTASNRSAASNTSSLGRELAATEINSSLETYRDGLRPGDHLSKGEDVTVTTNFLWLRKTPPTIFQYRVDFGPTISKQPARAGKEIRRRDEKVQVFRALEPILKAHSIRFAVSHAGDFLWTLKSIPGIFAHDSERYNNISYTRKDGVTETLSHLRLTRDSIKRFGPLITSKDVYGTAAAPRVKGEQQELLDMMIAFHSQPALMDPGCIKVGANRYFPIADFEGMNPAMLIGKGYFLSVRATQGGLGAIVNTTTTCFVKEVRVSDYIRVLLNKGRMDPRLLSVVLRMLKVKVNVERGTMNPGEAGEADQDALGKRVKSIWSTGKPLGIQRFYDNAADKSGKSVLEYHTSKYGAQIPGSGLDPKLPAINVGKDERANPHLAIWYPAELLTVLPNQQVHAKAQQPFVSDIITVAARNADVNKRMISTRGLSVLGLHAPDSLAQNFEGFAIDNTLADVNGKMLSPPVVKYKTGTVQVQNASWDLRAVKGFATNGKVQTIPVLVLFDSSKGQPQVIADQQLARATTWCQGSFMPQMQLHGWTAIKAASFKYTTVDVKSLEVFRNTVQEKLKKAADGGFKLVLVVLASDSKLVYGAVKRAGDLHAGIATSCVLSNKIAKLSPQYSSNIITKMNIRLGGVNHHFAGDLPKIGINPATTIVMGADVMHMGTAEGRLGAPSIACVVGNTDDGFVTYPASMRMQMGGQERIEHIAEMTAERVKAWLKTGPHQGKLPEALIFFRDGVSDSQYENIVKEEEEGIRKGLRLVDKLRTTKQYRQIKIVYLMVSKRHQTRFYPHDQNTLKKHIDVGHGNNIKPGFCIDRDICHPYRFDFYLQAHCALKGTARPAHYFCLRNDLKLNSKAMITMAHIFSYGLGRATKGISYATPAFLADTALNYAANWLVYGEPENIPMKSFNESMDEFRKRFLQYLRPLNPSWFKIGRPGPWHESLDDIMMYT